MIAQNKFEFKLGFSRFFGFCPYFGHYRIIIYVL